MFHFYIPIHYIKKQLKWLNMIHFAINLLHLLYKSMPIHFTESGEGNESQLVHTYHRESNNDQNMLSNLPILITNIGCVCSSTQPPTFFVASNTFLCMMNAFRLPQNSLTGFSLLLFLNSLALCTVYYADTIHLFI